jgi:hypothetical protein
MIKKSVKAQEEMVGFALILIIVSVILIIFLGFSIKDNDKEAVESYEVESYIQSFLQYTTNCRDNLEPLSIQEMVYDCSNDKLCSDGRDICEVLEDVLRNITQESWKVGIESPVKGYELIIGSSEENILEFREGSNNTGNSKGSIQHLPNSIEITFTAHY